MKTRSILTACLVVLATAAQAADQVVPMGQKTIQDAQVSRHINYLDSVPNRTAYSNQVEVIDPPMATNDWWGMEGEPMPDNVSVVTGYVVAVTNRVSYIDPTETLKEKYRRLYYKHGDVAFYDVIRQWELKKWTRAKQEEFEDLFPHMAWPFTEN